MTDPLRLRDSGSDAPEELRLLFRAGKPPEAMSEATRAALGARVSAIATLRTPLLVKALPWLLGAATLGGSVLVSQQLTSRSQAHGPQLGVASGPMVVSPSAVILAPAASAVAGPSSPDAASAMARPQAPPPLPAPRSSNARGDALSIEAQLLNAAHRALANDPKKALAVAREHERRYPQGQLRAERELIVVQALVKLGRVQEAESRGRGLRKAAPKSIYEERLDKVLGGP